MNWSARPFVRILFFYIAGILVVKYIPAVNNIGANALLIIATVLLISATVITIRRLKHKYTQISGLLFGVLITVIGVLISSQNSFKIKNPNLSNTKQTYLANVVSNPVETGQSVKAVLSVTSTAQDSSHTFIPEKALCYFTKDSLSTLLKYGDVITFQSNLTIPKGPLNPGEFDYGKYLLQSNIVHTSYIAANNWKIIGYSPKNQLIAAAGKIRQKLLMLLSKNGLSGRNYAVAAAILLGYDDFMENDLKQDYIMAGAMHILCVSGLHVGIIYLVINFILSFIYNSKFNNIFKAIVLLFSVWAYATITGLSPSVQRASLMLTVFIIGNILRRNRDTYNTLAISALILLIFNPQLIFNIGFQLSYAAVLGIITFHQPIYHLIYIKNGFIDKIWSISVLSFAAQLATFPIAIYYFHFFPPWFWLTNLFTFPLSFLIITTGLLFVITLWIPMIPQLIGWALSGMIYLLNYVVGFVKYLPFSGIDYIFISLPMLILVYILILLTYTMFNSNKTGLLTPIGITILLIIGLSTYHNYNIVNQKKVVIYNINRHRAYDFIDGKQHVLLTDSALINNTLDYQLKNSRTLWGIDTQLQTIPTKGRVFNINLLAIDNFLVFDDFKILLADGNEVYYPAKSKLSLDLVIISGKKMVDINQLISVFNFSKVVLDSSVPYWNQDELLRMFNDKGVDCYIVRKEGAYIINL